MSFGQSINPALGMPNWGALVQAGQNKAAGMQMLGQGMANATGSIVDALKERDKQQKEAEKEAESARAIAALIEKKSPGLIPNAGEMADILGNKDIPISERLNAATGFKSSLQAAFMLGEEQRANQRMGLEQMQQNRLLMEVLGGGQPNVDPLDNYFDFGGSADAQMPEGTGGMSDYGILPTNPNVPSNPYVNGLDPNMIQY